MKYKRKTREEREKEIDVLCDELVNGVSSEIASGNIQAILENIAKFQYGYSLNNCLLIYLQNPEASIVSSYTHWKQANRQVQSGQQGMKILCPVKYKYEAEVPIIDKSTNEKIYDLDGKEITERKQIEGIGFKIGYVFDISQTSQIEGKPEVELEVVKNLQGSIGDHYQDLMQAIKESSTVPIRIGSINNGANGYFSPLNQEIVVKEGMSQKQTLKTSLHELAHSILHNSERSIDKKITYYVSGDDRHYETNNLFEVS